MRVPFFDLRVLDPDMRKELLEAINKVFDHGKLILGPEVDEFEKRVADFIGMKHAIGVASGSNALFLALKSLGIGPGDEVITTPLTWIITLNAIAECDAVPVCVDICDDFNIDPEKIEPAITKKTKAILPVHFTGHMCKMDRICSIAKKHNLFVIEDAAQAYGAKYKSKMAGSFSDVAAFSMNTMKVLSAYGEAGAVTTDSTELYEKIKMLRYTGTKSDPKKIITNECYYVSLNHKIDTMQAALLLVAMKHLPAKMKRRQEIADKYTQALSGLVKCPQTASGDVHAYYTYAIQADGRDQLQAYLNSKEIETKIYHVPLANKAPVHAKNMRYETPVAQRVLDRFLSIPAHEKITDEQVDFVIKTIQEYYQ
ncbi:MAG: DegT/DnrJ/EryC1/StrS family aminotransferase [Candidatus Omnitrophica bacterium]|nr:DegT/DnrJ/EryC1/StrS family aminotransferase [Candidatus Omnitrophota bacterium]